MECNNRNNVIDYYDITTPGNASDFGSTVETVVHGTAVSSGSRVVYTEYSPIKYATSSCDNWKCYRIW